jgi:hypothetical protein
MTARKRQTAAVRSRPLTWREYVLIAVVAVLLGLSILFQTSPDRRKRSRLAVSSSAARRILRASAV